MLAVPDPYILSSRRWGTRKAQGMTVDVLIHAGEAQADLFPLCVGRPVPEGWGGAGGSISRILKGGSARRRTEDEAEV